jgi:NifU-like protein involved in Fe-S cluster formation
MDEQVIKYYRQLCKTGFKYSGSLENPSIFLDTVGEKIRICSHVTNAYLHIYINVRDEIIDDIKYLCTCDPTANVAVEVFCNLIKGKNIREVESLTVDDFSRMLGSNGDEFIKKAAGLIELLHRGLERFKNGTLKSN